MIRVSALFCVVILLSPCRADENAIKMIKEKLETARSKYAADADKFRKVVAAQLDEREKKARDKGDKKTVDLVKAERQAFEDKGELPKSIPQETKAKFTAAQKSMEVAYKEAIGGYTTGKKDDDATAIEKEMEEFLKGNPVSAAQDKFQKGSVWKGTRHFTKGPQEGKMPEMELQVKERIGDTFKGTTVIAKNNINDVEGTIKDGKIEWKVVKVVAGALSGTHTGGTITGEKIHFEVKGEKSEAVIDLTLVQKEPKK